MSLSKQEELRLDPENLKPGPYVSYMTRRETHSSRAVTSVIVALITLALMAYVATEGILGMLGKKPLLLSWSEMVDYLVKYPDPVLPAALIIIGIVLALVGLLLLVKALRPGPLGRHAITDQRSAYIIDDAVVASAISRNIRENAGLGQGQVSTEVRRRSLTAMVTPTSGIPLSAEEIERTLVPEVKSYNLSPDPKVNVNISEKGVVSN